MRRFIAYKIPHDAWFTHKNILLEYIDIDFENKKLFIKHKEADIYEETSNDYAQVVISDIDRFIYDEKIKEIGYIPETANLTIYDFL